MKSPLQSPFPRIGLFAKHNDKNIEEIFEKLVNFLVNQHHSVTIETISATLLPPKLLQSNRPQSITFPVAPTVTPREQLGQNVDLVIVLGGDGSLLNAARAVVHYNVPILGINRGRLGFLADILPQEMESKLGPILQGDYTEERRFLLSAEIVRKQQTIAKSEALNDIVLYAGNIARMIEFEVYINQQFVLRQRADGLITATPTGSTAYALSGGGPILYPTLDTLVLVPMLPHTLSSRPIVVSNTFEIKLVVSENNEIAPKLSFDGQNHFDLLPGDHILIHKHDHELKLIHPKDHDYFSILRKKLAWSHTPIKV